jgi:hypothetical protein
MSERYRTMSSKSLLAPTYDGPGLRMRALVAGFVDGEAVETCQE